MSVKRRNFRLTFGLSAVLLAATAFYLISVMDNWPGARVDMTSDRLFTLSPAAKKILQGHRVDTRLAGREPPHRLKPCGQRFFGTVHDSSGRHRLVVPTTAANAKISCTFPVRRIPASRTYEAFGPPLLEKILITSLFVGKTLVKLSLIPRKILCDKTIGHCWPPRDVLETSLTANCDRCGHGPYLLENCA